jgi:type VI secretion system protein ImpL
MNKKSYLIIGSILVSFTLFVGWLGNNIRKVPGMTHVDPLVAQILISILGIVAAAIVAFIMSRRDKKSGSEGGAAAEAPEEVTDLDELLAEAEARLAVAQQQKDSKLGKLPAILLVGETGSAKTTTMVQSGAEPESLAGQVYEENNILPTPAANFWFAHHTVFVEMAGKLLGDTDAWKQLIGRLQPPRAAALIGTAEQVPRAVLVCVDAESLTSPSPDPLAASARKLRTQLTEISRLLGINLPVYVLFTRSDRLPFFTEYFSKLNNEETRQILGATLPIVQSRQGIYAEQETTRIGGVFEKLFRALCNARPTYLVRESDPLQLAGIYEFPREFHKIRMAMVRFLVELCRPSQITVGPFLRGFYFSGVRPIMVNEVAPAAPMAAEAQAGGGRVGATGMFRAKAGMAQAGGAGQRIVGQRKVPQWLFLGHFFNDLLLADQAAKGASASSIRASVPRRILLLAATALCLLYSMALLISFGHNRTLANNVKKASQGIAAVDLSAGGPASLDSLQRLEALRQSLETLTDYNRHGAPWGYRWGLYIGDDLYPDVRKLYFADFRRLLLLPTQNILVDSMRSLPPAPPGPEYKPTYDSLKAYLETTSNHDKTTRDFLPPVLLDRWSANRNVDPDRMQLAQKQFEFYSDELKIANPYSNDNDAATIGKARLYLSQFAGFERVYQAMMADAAKTGPPINFNKRFPGSADEVIDNQDVAAPYTKPGWDFMKTALRNPEKYFAGEPWVLGDQNTASIDRSKLGQQLADRYYADYIKAWRAYMKAASVVRYASLPDASKKLGALSGNQSPLLALFALASQNTAVDLPDVANAFQPVQVAVPPTLVDRYIAPANQTYMNALVTLQASVDAVAQTPTDNAAAATTLTNAMNAHVAAKQVAQAFRIDADAHIEGVVQKLMEDPITYVEALLRTLGPAELNGKGKTLCSIYRPVLNKFPFNPAATPQATVDDVNALFKKPDGALWKFYDENLQKLLPKQGSQYVAATVGNVTLTPQFVAFFNQAAAFAEALYAGGTPDPHFTYTLKPVPSDGIEAMGLHLDGQDFTYSGGDATAKQFVWQGTGAHGAKATIKFGSTDLAWASYDGLWAVFQFFNQADTWHPAGNGNILEWIVRAGKNPMLLPSGKPLTVRFELDMGAFPPVFQKGYFARMACVADVAKQ